MVILDTYTGLAMTTNEYLIANWEKFYNFSETTCAEEDNPLWEMHSQKMIDKFLQHQIDNGEIFLLEIEIFTRDGLSEIKEILENS